MEPGLGEIEGGTEAYVLSDKYLARYYVNFWIIFCQYDDAGGGWYSNDEDQLSKFCRPV
jgi:hypothetical protein